MITIEEVQRFADWINGEETAKPQFLPNKHELSDLALSQHEEIERLNRTNAADKLAALTMLRENQFEIERLRAELDLANKFIDQAFEAHPNLPLDIEFLEKSGEPK